MAYILLIKYSGFHFAYKYTINILMYSWYGQLIFGKADDLLFRWLFSYLGIVKCIFVNDVRPKS